MMQTSEPSRGARITIGFIVGVGGLAFTVAALRSVLLVANPLQSSELVGVLIGLCFMFAGVSMSMRPAQAFQNYLFGALTITFLALCFDWVAFAPGPREFHSGASSLHQGGSVNSSVGRVVFGFVAILMDFFVVYAWRVTFQVLTTGSSKAGIDTLAAKIATRPDFPGPTIPVESRRPRVVAINCTIAVMGLLFLVIALFSFVSFLDAHMAFKRVEGEPYHAATFQVVRPYYQKSAGMHGPDISVYARGIVEGREEWMNLFPYLKRKPLGQDELNELAPPGTAIPVYLFPNFKGRSRIQVIDDLPPGEASRRTAAWVLWRAPLTLAILSVLILLLVRVRRRVVENVRSPAA